MNKKLASGLVWSITEVVIKRSLDFIVKLILARLLFPEDFGVVGMATVFTSFIQVLNDAGMGPAIIQKKNLTEKHLNTVFWTNVIWSSFLYLILSFVVAPFAADFYQQPILIKVIPILSISIVTSALNTVHFSQLRKELNFKKIALIRNFSSFVSGIVAVAFAFLNFGVWSLVINDVLAYVISVPLFYNATKWKPSLQWDKKILKEVLTFGLFITGSKLIVNLVGSADYLLLGRWVSASAVGIYTLAFMMTNLVSGQITSMLDTVLFPFYSSIQDDMKKLKEYYLNVISIYAILLFPIMLTLILFASFLVPLIFGNQWEETIIPLRILAGAVMVNVLTTGYNILFRSIGKPQYEFRIQQYTSLLVYLPLLCFGIYFYGIVGAALGVLVSRLINFNIHQYVLRKYFDIKFMDLFSETYKVMLICLVLTLETLILRYFNMNQYIVLVLYLFSGIVLYWFSFKPLFLKLMKRSKK